MIKIIHAEYVKDKILRINFSDSHWGDYDLQPIIDQQSTLTKALAANHYFKQFYLEMGALCWRNGLELSPSHIYYKLQEQNLLHHTDKVA